MSPTPGNLLVLAVISMASLAYSQDGAPIDYAREDPTKIKTAEACRECHAAEFDVWRSTPHAKGFKTLHRKKAAQNIAKKLGYKLVKRESLCLTCHYTPILKGTSLRAESGVSCESCHGAGADWMNVHNNYGGKGITFETETSQHRARRIEESRRLGMRRPSDLYEVASRCFQCHTVPDERLVNVGGHGTGSSDFEFTAWSQGDIRHNFLQSFLTGDGTDNAERGLPRKRVMYVLGRMLDLEYSLRGVAVAKEKKRYFKAMSRRLRNSINELRAINKRITIDQVGAVLTIAREAKATPNREKPLLTAAAAIGEAARAFLTDHDGSLLAPLDGLVSGTDDAPPEEDEPPITTADGTDGGNTRAGPAQSEATSGTANNPAAGASNTAGQGTAPQTATRQEIRLPGKIHQRLRPKSSFAVIGPGKCGNCHDEANAWWFDDRHYASADPFFEGRPKNMQMAQLYGIGPSAVIRGDKLCMDCHATVISGKERRDITEGVSCESCHGPAASYLEPHQDGEKNLGDQRPGYLAALKKGMSPLRDLEVRAKTCAACHYVTDERLLASGHPSGEAFDFSGAMQEIRHWDRPAVAASALKQAWQRETSARGPIPKVTVVKPAPPTSSPAATAPGSNGPNTVGSSSRSTGSGGFAGRSQSVRPKAVVPRPVAAHSVPDPDQVVPLFLPPFPEITEATSVEDSLRLLKQRLELLYRVIKNPDEHRKEP